MRAIAISVLLGLALSVQAQEPPDPADWPIQFYHDDGHFNTWYFLYPSQRHIGVGAFYWCYDEPQYVLRWTVADIWWMSWNGYRPPDPLEGVERIEALDKCGYDAGCHT